MLLQSGVILQSDFDFEAPPPPPASHAILRYLACAFPGVVDHCLVLNNVFCSFLKVSDLFKRSKIESVLDWHHSNLRCGAATYVLNTMLAPVLGLQLNPQAAAEGIYAWTHKSWRVREEFARTVTSAIGLFASTELPLQRAILPPEMYTRAGPQFRDELQRHHLPTSLTLFSGLTLQNVLKENSIEISEESFFELKYDPESVWGYMEVFSPC
ncbi:hypothetical protein TEA_019479 [Camellia sinensis var. sinensis]|uniref:Uncharacterized protein n=1 Tax=Camellia sinensis var. sinensis TaxID=542762 RepID=A0A4S4EMK5_CAMSN|nr:hypothetical protein TEA_019479 [Camellia sinensis var. sinensis]